MKRLAYMIPIILAFLYFDALLSEGRTLGGARNSVIGSTTRWARADRTRILVIGSSTTSDLMPPGVIAKALGVRKADVTNGRINGCHQGCSWGEFRAMMQRTDTLNRQRRPPKGRRFSHIFMGVNLFQQCEDGHSKRVMQHLMLTPPRDLPALLAIYAQAERPMRRVGRALGMTVSGVYGEPAGIKRRLGWSSIFSLRGRWFSKARAPRGAAFCDYEAGETALKTAFMRSLTDDMARRSDKVTLVLLPDQALAARDPAQMAQLPAFRAWAQAIADRHPNIELLDFVAGNTLKRRDFRDTIHFTGRAVRPARARFIKLFKAQAAADAEAKAER